ncbi:MAG: thioredoxin family protein [Lentisphaerae bacterium]|nr:thioredoxin family protein [Lentisphaerota bacterium]
MKKRSTFALSAVVIGLCTTWAFAGAKWETDFEAASKKAKASNRYMLLDFSGSDWCGWCIRLDKEVFSKKDFKDYAKKNLVCVLVDFPRRKALRKRVAEQNKKLAAKYKVRGYPTVMILSPGGDTVAQTGYRKGGAKAYVKHLGELIDPHRKKNNIPGPTSATKSGATTRGSSVRRLQPLVRKDDRETRTWTSRAGDTLVASIVEEKGPYVRLKREDGTITRILASVLSKEDLAYISELKKAQTADPGN